jgi:hypothetical protein
MRPASHSPNSGLLDQERVQCAEPAFVIDAGAGALLGANAGGWRAWGLEPATAAPPVAIDGAMPALQRLREIAGGRGGVSSGPEALTFWTAGGVVRLICRVETSSAAGATVMVKVLGAGPAAAAMERDAIGYATRGYVDGHAGKPAGHLPDMFLGAGEQPDIGPAELQPVDRRVRRCRSRAGHCAAPARWRTPPRQCYESR